MKMKLILIIWVSLFLAACSTGEHGYCKKMKQPTVTITKILNLSGSIVLEGSIVNQGATPVNFPWIGDPIKPDQPVNTTVGIIDQKMNNEWNRMTPFRDGIRPVRLMNPGESIQFRHETVIPFPKEKKLYRLTFPGIQPVEFTCERKNSAR